MVAQPGGDRVRTPGQDVEKSSLCCQMLQFLGCDVVSEIFQAHSHSPEHTGLAHAVPTEPQRRPR